MRYIIVLISAMAVLALACGGGETPRAPSGEAGGMEGFRTFATEIERAIAKNDSQFFVERAVLQEVTCNGDEPLAPCEGQPAGTTLRGVPGGVFQSDASNLFPPEEYAQVLDRYFSAALVDESDQYGSGSLILYALARRAMEGTAVFQAITTSIVDTYPTGYPIGTKEREAHVFSFSFDEGRWQFTGEGVAVSSASSSNWLSGECADCYVEWERWPASPLARDAAAAATAVAGRGGFPTAQEAIAAYGEAWLSAFLGDCDAVTTPQVGSCLPANREVGESDATYRLCRVGVGACLLVTLARGDDGLWTLTSVDAYGEGPGPTEEIVP